jgi:MFS family permease
MFITGLAWYSLWSMITGVSVYSGVILFSISRAFQGLGLSLVVPNGLAILGREFSGHQRSLVFSLFGACAPGGFQLGGIFTAIFAQYTWWRKLSLGNCFLNVKNC